MNDERVVRFLVVEDQFLVGQSVGTAIAAQGGFEFLGVSRSVDDAVESARRLEPDVVVADLGLGTHLAFDLPGHLRDLDVPVLYLTGMDTADTRRRAMDAGAAGMVNKSESVERLARIVRRVADGAITWKIGDLQAVGSRGGGPTDREREVLTHLVGGLANKEIADALGIHERTVETHIRRMFDRYGTMSRVQLAVLALREAWVLVPGDDHD